MAYDSILGYENTVPSCAEDIRRWCELLSEMETDFIDLAQRTRSRTNPYPLAQFNGRLIADLSLRPVVRRIGGGCG
jgi:hypothetical protein